MPVTVETKSAREEFLRLPEGAPYQLIGGQLVREPSPVPMHQRISRRIGTELIRHVEERKLGEVFYAPLDVYLSDEETYQPDILFIGHERRGIIGETRIEAAPDLIIEILSPSTADYDLRHKKSMYESAGVKEYWIVDPLDRSIDVLVIASSEGRFQLFAEAKGSGNVSSKLLAGFTLNLEYAFDTP